MVGFRETCQLPFKPHKSSLGTNVTTAPFFRNMAGCVHLIHCATYTQTRSRHEMSRDENAPSVDAHHPSRVDDHVSRLQEIKETDASILAGLLNAQKDKVVF